MMDVFRRAAQGWTAKILIGLLVVSFGVWGIADVFRGFSTGNLATIGSQRISADQFTQTFRQALQNYSRQIGENLTPDRARELGIDRQVLNEMLRSAAVMSEAQSLKLAVGDDFIAADAAKNPNFTDSQGKFDPEEFKRILQRSGQSPASYLALQRDQMLRSAVADTVQGEVTLPSTMIEAAARHADEQRDARYFVVKAQASEVAQPGEQDIKKFYDENPVNYTATEYRSIALLYVEPSDLAPSIKLTDEEIKAGYDKYKSEYFSPERRTLLQTTFPSVEEAAKAKERIRSDADFLAIAKERGLSDQDAAWADRTKADILDPKIADAAFALKQGELSNPVEGQLAVMLLKAVKITPEHQQTFDEARDAIAKRLRLEKAGEAIRSIYDTVEEGRAAQTPFEELAKISNIGFMLVPAIDAKGRDKDGKDVSLPHRSDVLKLAFQTDVGVENDAFATKEDGLIWYEVREVVPSQVKPFDTVKEQVKADWTARKIRDLAIDKARKLAERANAGASLEDLARESGSEIKTSQGLKRSTASQDFDGPAVTALFSVPPGGVTFAPEADGQGAKVIQSQAVLAPPFDPKSAEADEIRKPASQAAGLDLLGSYLANLQNQLGITVNETLWRQITGAPQQ